MSTRNVDKGREAEPDAGDDDTTPHWERADGSSRYDQIVAADRERRAEPDAGDVEALKAVLRQILGAHADVVANHILASDWLAARDAATADRARREGAVEAGGPLSDDEANQVDFEMGEHMYRHSISNNIGYMGCDVGCRTGALKRAIDKVLAARIARSTS